MKNKTLPQSRLRFILASLKFDRRQFGEGLLIGALFSLFIYLEHFGLRFELLNSLAILYAYYRLFKASQGTLVVAGFFIGSFWFYWVGFSFRYVDMWWMIPLISLVFSLGYTFIFWLIGFVSHPLLRMPLFFGLIFYEPLSFNWFKPELPFIHTYFGIQLWQFALILATLALVVYFKERRWHPALLLLLIGAVDYSSEQKSPKLPLDTKVVQTNLDQSKKWLPGERRRIVLMNFAYIAQAIHEGKKLIVLPESTMPLYLNLNPHLQKQLKVFSQEIDIIIGALLWEDENAYNATYFYSGGNEQIAKKMILVPFGEYIPLPKFLRDLINKAFFDGGNDFKTADAPTDFEVQGEKLRNAICYEATYELFYKGGIKYIVAISNNAWFVPSTEPTLQKLLIQLYAKRHGVTVIHSVNGSQSMVIGY